MEGGKSFRQALGEFATGVSIVTAAGPDTAPVGMTMTSFNSVSLDPPLVLFSVDRRALSLRAMQAATSYAVSVLSRAQRDVSDRFARALSAKWESTATRLGEVEAPLIEGALAHFECLPYAIHDGGDHVIFVARVVGFRTNPDKPEALLFFRGSYRSTSETLSKETDPPWPLPSHY